MPRDSNGDVTLPAGNPVVADTDITASWGNTTMADMATMMQDSLSRSGKGGMLVGFQHSDGTVAAPGITFTNQTGTGFYRSAAGIGVAIAGVLKALFASALATFKTAVKVEGALEVTGDVTADGVIATTTYDYATAKTEVKTMGVSEALFTTTGTTFVTMDSARPATIRNGAGNGIVAVWTFGLPRGSTAKSVAFQHYNNSGVGVAPTIVVRHYAKSATLWTATLLYNATLTATAAATDAWRTADITDQVMAEGDLLVIEITIPSSAAADQYLSGASVTYDTTVVANVT